jgi:glucan 1,3-beta-glucosidase
MAFFGICYSPYHRSNVPPPNQKVTAENVIADIGLIKGAGYTAIRTYSIFDVNIEYVTIAVRGGGITYFGLGAWLDPGNPSWTKDQITSALNQVTAIRVAEPGLNFDCDLVVGNEVDIQPGVTADQVKGMMTYAKGERDLAAKKIPWMSKVRITTCITANALQLNYPQCWPVWGPIVQQCEGVVYVTVYPYLDPNGPPAPDNIKLQMDWASAQFKQATGVGKEVVIAEIGWPTSDLDYPKSATPANQKTNYGVTKQWVSVPNLNTFWFEMFDEPWKTDEPRGYGPYWGLYDKDGKKKW